MCTRSTAIVKADAQTKVMQTITTNSYPEPQEQVRHKLGFPAVQPPGTTGKTASNAVGRKTNAGRGQCVSPNGTVLAASALLEDTAAVPGTGIVEQASMLTGLMESVVVGL